MCLIVTDRKQMGACLAASFRLRWQYNTTTKPKATEWLVVRSTAFGVKIVIGLMMADRLSNWNRFRSEYVEESTFTPVTTKDTKNKDTAYIICHEQLYQPAHGITEVAFKLDVCCDRIIEDVCLKPWVDKLNRCRCPRCRTQFSSQFVRKPLHQPGLDPNKLIAADQEE